MTLIPDFDPQPISPTLQLYASGLVNASNQSSFVPGRLSCPDWHFNNPQQRTVAQLKTLAQMKTPRYTRLSFSVPGVIPAWLGLHIPVPSLKPSGHLGLG